MMRTSVNKEMNKVYSRRNRRKKKQYIKQLEDKITQLETKVESLTDQIYHYKLKVNSMLIGDEDDFKEFKECLEYAKTDFKKKLETCKDDSWRDDYQKVIDTLGPTGKRRQAVINNAFNAVIENIVPDGMKYLMYLCGGYHRRAEMKDYEKLLKLSKESALDILKTDMYDPADQILYENGSSVTVRMFLENHYDLIKDVKDYMIDIFSTLLSIKTKVFK